MSYTIVRRDFLKCALASAVVFPVLGAADARATDLPLLDPTDPVAQSLGFVPDASKVAVNANSMFKPGQLCGVCMQYQQDSSTSDATLRAFDDAEYISERDPLDSSDLLASLLETATVALNTDRRVTQKCIRRAAVLLGIDLSRREDATAERSHLQGGLAPWQARRLRSYIEEKLDSTLRAGDLAGLVRLSTSYFFRAFRKTFGETPVAYIMKRRMLRAQELMLKSRVSLSQVALECGMCDQAHFSRTFRRIVGINPTAWRRQLLQRPTFCENASLAAQRAAADSSSNGLNAPVVMAPVIQRALERGNEHVCEID